MWSAKSQTRSKLAGKLRVVGGESDGRQPSLPSSEAGSGAPGCRLQLPTPFSRLQSPARQKQASSFLPGMRGYLLK